MKGYKNWCNATSASTMVETMSKSSIWCVHQMACNIYIYILIAHRNLLSEQPSGIHIYKTYILNWFILPCMYSMTLRRDILTYKNVDGRLFHHADTWTHIPAINKLLSSSVSNKILV
jgi:hypothetical protein